MNASSMEPRFGLPDALRFEEGPGGLTLAEDRNRCGDGESICRARMWRVAAGEREDPVLFMMRRAYCCGQGDPRWRAAVFPCLPIAPAACRGRHTASRGQ